MSTNNLKNGFTLVEILTVMTIVSLVSGAVFALTTVSLTDPLNDEYDKALGLVYEKRLESILNPHHEYEITTKDFMYDSEVQVEIHGNPVFNFGEFNSDGSIRLLYADRMKEIKISGIGSIE